MSAIVPVTLRKVTYEVKQWNSVYEVKAFLPAGFTMRDYTRVFNIENRKDYGMTAEDYILWQTELLKQDLLVRLDKVDQAKLLGE